MTERRTINSAKLDKLITDFKKSRKHSKPHIPQEPNIPKVEETKV